MAFLSFFLSWVQLFDRVIFLIFFVLSLFGPVVSFSKIWPLKFLDRELRLLPRTLFSGIETRVATGLMSGFNGVVSGRGGVGWDTYIYLYYIIGMAGKADMCSREIGAGVFGIMFLWAKDVSHFHVEA